MHHHRGNRGGTETATTFSALLPFPGKEPDVNKLKSFTILFVLTIVFLVRAPTSEASHCRPGPDEVALFRHADFFSDTIDPCGIRGVGRYPHSEDTGLPNDSLSSIRVGPNVQVRLCRDANFAGGCQDLGPGDYPRLSLLAIGNDTVSSISVKWRWQDPNPCIPGEGEVGLFRESFFRGGCVVLGRGEYAHSYNIDLPNDSISSIMIGSRAFATVFCDANFRGTRGTFTARSQTMRSQEGVWLDDCASSIIVDRFWH